MLPVRLLYALIRTHLEPTPVCTYVSAALQGNNMAPPYFAANGDKLRPIESKISNHFLEIA